MYVAPVPLLRSPLLPPLNPHSFLGSWWWAVIITSVSVIMVMEMTGWGGKGGFELPLFSVGHEQEFSDLDYLSLHQDPVTSSAIAVGEVQLGNSGGRETHTSVSGTDNDPQLE